MVEREDLSCQAQFSVYSRRAIEGGDVLCVSDNHMVGILAVLPCLQVVSVNS
jgi:hypothetical protein